MEFKTYVQNMVATYVEKLNKKAVFIKHYNTLDISKEEMLAYVKTKNQEHFLYHEYAINDLHAPYEPFLEWIRQCYYEFYGQSMSVEEFLKASGVYAMHIEPLTHFLNEGMCKRKEDILPAETDYEIQQMLRSLIGILEFVSKEHNLIIILSKFHLAPYSTIKLVKQVLNESLGLHAIIMYNDVFYIPEYKKGIWDALMHDVVENDLQMEWGRLDTEKTVDMQDEFWFREDKVKDYFVKLINMYHTLALEDAYYYMSDIVYKLEQKSIWIPKNDQRLFFELAAFIYMGVGNVNQALVACDKIISLYNPEENPKTDYMYYYLSARAQMMLAQIGLVEKYCKKCMEIARKIKDPLLEFKAQVMLCTARYGGWKEIFHYDFRHKVEPELIDKTKEFGFENFLAYLYVFGFENDADTIQAIAMGEKEPYYFNLGIQIGTALGNENFLLLAYMKNIILYTDAGYHHYVRKMYEKIIKVLNHRDPCREANMLAGLGYNSIILEEYEKAYGYFMQSIRMQTALEKPDGIMDSMYNLALNYFVGEAYEDAVFVINIIIKMLDALGYQATRVCSTSKLYGMLAVSCYYQGEYYNSYYYLSKIEIIIEHLLHGAEESDYKMWEEDLFLYHLVKGLLYDYEKKDVLCQKEMDLAKKFMLAMPGAMFYTYPLFALEQAAIYEKKQMKKEAEAVLLEAIAFCKKEGLHRKEKRLQAFLEEGKHHMEPLAFNKEPLPVSQIMQIAKYEGAQNKLKRKEKDIDFLTVWQEIMGKEKMTIDALFQNAVAVLQNSFNLDGIVILQKSADRNFVAYGKEDAELDEEKINHIFDFFSNYKRAFLTNHNDKNFMQFMPIMQYFGVEHIVTMIGIPIVGETGIEHIFLAHVNMQQNFMGNRVLLNGDNLLILKFAFSQFCETLRRIDNRETIERMNQKLEESVVTDYLTGISNRKGFIQQVEILCADKDNKSNVILYLDLDNFKYYNDTFGHEVGDLVLVCFAKLFEKLTDEKGVAVRYGGDEFIILLPNQNEIDGVHLAHQIYEEIEDGFQKEIREKLNMEINIPKNKRVSCSIGIAACKGSSKNELMEALNQADQALYYVKRHGKGKYMVASS